MKTWNKPEALEIKMDAEISSYQDDNYDPHRDGPLFVEETVIDLENKIPKA